MRRRCAQGGSTLIETVCVLAVVAMLAAIAMPAFPHHTSRARLEAYALETAALLKADRAAAIRRGAEVATVFSAATKTIRSGADNGIVRVPDDIAFNAMLAARCGREAAGTTIQFFPSGMSCGGALSLSRLGAAFEVRVAWLTGGVEIVPTTAF